MYRGYKFRLKPTAAQAAQLRRAAGCCRFVWNWFRSQREAVHKASEGRVRVGRYAMDAQLPPMKLQYPWLKEAAPSQALQQTLIDLDTAYAAFFDGRKGYPHKKCRDDGDSFRLPQGFERNGQAVKLPKVGWVRCVITRPILGAVCNITISRDGEHWYVSFCAEESVPADTRREREAQIIAMEDEAGRREAVAGGAIGIDWGVERPLTLSTGKVIQLPRVTAAEREHLAVLQRRISTKERNSANCRKAVARLTVFTRKLRNRRLDALHKITTDLAKSHRLIVIEDLHVSNMTESARGTVENPGSQVAQKAGLNRSILDLSPGLFRRLLTDKCERFGAQMVVVPAHYTSQECSCCSHIDSANRTSQARFSCVACGHTENADVNAAKVILARGIAAISPEAGYASDVWRPRPGTTFREAA